MQDINITHILLTIIGFLIVYVLNGIKAEIKEVKTTVKNLETNLQTGINDLDIRVTKIETIQKLGDTGGFKTSY